MRYSVDVTSGQLAFSPPPDLVTGLGDFPYSLAYQRVYSPTSGSFTCTDGVVASPESGCFSTQSEISGLPIGWTHTLAVTARLTNDGLASMGRASALDASSVIAALYVTRQLSTSAPTFASRLAAIFVTNWLGENLVGNVVAVRRPPEVAAFVRLADGSFNPEPGRAETLVQTGSRTFCGLDMDWDNGPLAYTLTTRNGETITFGYASPQATCGIPSLFIAKSWTFPDNMAVTFNYAAAVGVGQDQSQCLTSVTNNLGRSLNFNNTCTSPPTAAQTVQDDAGRTVTIALLPSGLVGEGSGSIGWWGPQDLLKVTGLTVTGPDGGTSEFDYVPRPTTNINRSYYRVYNWLTPLETATSTTAYVTATFDSLYRVKAITDNSAPNRFSTNYFIAGLFGSEFQKRADVIDPLGAMTTSYADRWNNTVEVIDPLGRITAHVLDSNRRVIKTVYPESNFDTLTYDVRSNQLSVIRNPVPGSTLALVTTSTVYPEGPTVVACASPATCNQPQTITDANGHEKHFNYAATGQLQRFVGPTISSPTSGAITGQDTGQSQIDYCYQSAFGSTGNVSLLIGTINKVASNHRVKAFSYNGSASHWTLNTMTVDPATTYQPPTTPGSVCTTSTKTSPAPLQYVTTYTFDAIGNVSTVENANSNTTNYIFDSMRRLITVTPPSLTNTMTRYCYDADGELLSTNRWHGSGAPTDPNANATNGQCSSAYPTNNWMVENRQYYPSGDLESVSDGVPNTTLYVYDADHRQAVVQDPVGRQTASVYDLDGEVIAKWRGGSGWINSSGSYPTISATAPTASMAWVPGNYAGTGPVRYESYCNGTPQSASQNCYSLNGKPLYAVDADSHVTAYQYDGFDRLRITYFPDPTLGTLCEPAGSDGPVGSAGAAPTCSGQQTYELTAYDLVGNRTSFLTRRGDTIGYQFDAEDRLVIKTPAGQGAVSLGLNLIGDTNTVTKATSGTLPSHTTSYLYNAAGRKTSESNDNVTVSYLYDGVGNRLETIWPDNYFVAYQYDALNRMQFARENSTSTNELAYYIYDPLSRRTSVCMGAGSSSCASTAWTNQVSYGYEPVDGQLNAITHQLNGTTVTYGYARNSAYQIQTLSVSDASYLPTPAVSSTTYTPNDLNEYGAVGGNTFQSDSNGNLTTWYPPGGTTDQIDTYDSENRLTQAVYGSVTDTFDYDGLGRRVSKTYNGTTTLYLLDGDEEIAEYSGSSLSSGTLLRRYVTGPAIDDRIAHVDGSSTSPVASAHTYYHVNHQGSVMDMTDNAGNVSSGQKFAYDEYGNLSAGSPTTGEQYRYAGRRYDAEVGLYYYRARYYAPQIGRFLQTDPIGYKDDINGYTYVGNDPLDKTDPTGNNADDVLDDFDALLMSNPELFGPLISGIGHGVGEGFSGLVGFFRGAGAAAAETTVASAATRATELAGTMSERTQRSVTIAVTETEEGTRVVSSSEGALRPATRAALQDGEVQGMGTAGTHAEVNGIDAAKQMGLTPTGTAASRPICPSCAANMSQQGVKPLSRLKAPRPPKPATATGPPPGASESCERTPGCGTR